MESKLDLTWAMDDFEAKHFSVKRLTKLGNMGCLSLNRRICCISGQFEEQICPEGHTIDAREADHSYTQECTINPFS
jgi:hypothetical protein